MAMELTTQSLAAELMRQLAGEIDKDLLGFDSCTVRTTISNPKEVALCDAACKQLKKLLDEKYSDSNVALEGFESESYEVVVSISRA